ncbi:MAG: hypothetical protein JNK21_01530 [Rhodospirillaceae bacterium]|nr:hypothetical protein [Rhodospirillaceae bacterium]
MHPILYLTSEISNRDWDARLMMADYAAARGLSVVVGQQWSVYNNALPLPKGLMLFKTVNEIQARNMVNFLKSGHIVASMDEESLAIAGDQDFIGAFSPLAAKACHVFYANSALHAQVLNAQITDLAGKIIATGNPRIDLLSATGRVRYEPEATAIRQKYGPFVLVNSNAASQNTMWQSWEQLIDIQVRAGVLNPNDPKSVEVFKKGLEYEQKNSQTIEMAIHWMAENIKSHAVVIRPHPTEKQETWANLMADNPRVHVVMNTNHVPWMMAADLVVHTNSTTGVEAAVLGRPTVNLMPDPEGHWSKIYLSSRLNTTFHDWPTASKAIAQFLATGGGPIADNAHQKAELKRYFPYLSDGSSSKRMVDHMIGMLKERGFTAARTTPEDVVNGFQPYPRPDQLKRKITKTMQEAVNDYKAIRAITKLNVAVSFTQIDDSLFLIHPQT